MERPITIGQFAPGLLHDAWMRTSGYPTLADEFFAALTIFLDDTSPPRRRLDEEAEQTLCTYCFILALFEQCFRRGPLAESPLFTVPESATLDDLLALASLLRPGPAPPAASRHTQSHARPTRSQTLWCRRRCRNRWHSLRLQGHKVPEIRADSLTPGPWLRPPRLRRSTRHRRRWALPRPSRRLHQMAPRRAHRRAYRRRVVSLGAASGVPRQSAATLTAERASPPVSAVSQSELREWG